MKKLVMVLGLAFAIACGGEAEEAANTATESAGEAAAAAGEAAGEAAAAAGEAAGEAAGAAAAAAGGAVAAAGEAAGGAAAAVANAGDSNFGTVSLAPGFNPDPATATGTSGGTIDAATLAPECLGTVSETPDHLFVAEGAFSNLRVMVNSQSDTTLVVQRPDGTYVCNDDGPEGLNPVIDAAFGQGTYKIWVGSYSGDNAPYTIGFTELAVGPSSI